MMFSIITITYNNKKTLAETIASVEAQTHTDVEHVFVDAFSTDGTLEMIQAYEQRNPGKVRWIQEAPKGISHAMNVGIKQAHGEYVMHIHADDTLYDAQVLADMAAAFKEKKCDWIYGKISVRDEAGNEKGIFPHKPIFHASSSDKFKSWLLQLYNFIPHQAVAIRKDVFTRFGYFDESISSGMDPDMWLRIRKSTTWTYIDRVIATFRMHADSQTASPEKQKENRGNVRTVQKRHLSLPVYILARCVVLAVHTKQWLHSYGM